MNMQADLEYTPPPTMRQFMLDDAFVRVAVGPLGSGKSMACLMELLRRSCEQEPDAQGVRPTRWAVVRNSAAQLRDTTLNDCKQYFPFAHWKVSTSTLEIRLPLPDGTVVHSDWLFIPLERPEDTRKLLSLNLTGGFIEECREIKFQIFEAMLGRIGRYPMKARVKPTWEGAICASNPWSEGSDWHEHLVLNKPDEWHLYCQPSGLSPEAENVENLPDNYYQRMIPGHTQNWIKVHIHGLWGDDESGQSVFRGSFDPGYHLAGSRREGGRLVLNPQLPVLGGVDFGRTGVCILGQENTLGQLLVFEEVVSDDLGLEGFLQDCLKPALRERYWQARVFLVGDPAGEQRSQLNEDSAFRVLKRHNLDAVAAPTNEIRARILAVEERLLGSRGRRPAILIDEDRCPRLAKALLYEYRYRRKREGDLNDLPEKNEASHVADALQYLCLGAKSNYVGRRISIEVGRAQASKRRAPPPSARGWT